MMPLYSFNGSYPEEHHPDSVRDGVYRRDWNDMSDSDRQSFGWYEIEEPPIVSDREELHWNGPELKWEVKSENAFKLAQKWQRLREQRNFLLKECDLFLLRLMEHNLKPIPEYVIYKQKLRDITLDFDHPDDVEWPVNPYYPPDKIKNRSKEASLQLYQIGLLHSLDAYL